MNSEVVVTGVAGFIGSHQAELLLRKGYDVVGMDNFHSYYSRDIKEENLAEVRETAEESEGEFRFHEGSIVEPGDLEQLPKKPRWVIHHAALAGTRYSVENPSEYSKINVHGTAELVKYFDDFEKLVYVSSSSVYGEREKHELPVHEDDELDPITPYSLSKVHAEQLVRMYSDLLDFEYATVRPFTVYGPRQRPDEVFTKFISMVLDGEPVTIYGDGTQSRDYTYVGDVVEGVLAAAKHGEGAYNLASNRGIAVEEVVDTIDKMVDEDVEKEYLERHEGDVSHTLAKIDRAGEHLDYSPDTDFEEGVRRCVENVKKRREKGVL